MKLALLSIILVLYSCKVSTTKEPIPDDDYIIHIGLDYVNYQIGVQKGKDVIDIDLIGLESMTLVDWQNQNQKVLHLFFAESKIVHLNLDFSEMTNLEKLVLSKTQLHSISSSIKELKNLEELKIYGSQVKEFPIEICELAKLKKLVFWRSKLTSLPDEISDLRNLEELNLIENQFSQNEKRRIKKLLPNCKISFDY